MCTHAARKAAGLAQIEVYMLLDGRFCNVHLHAE